jgi:hypothetical protein
MTGMALVLSVPHHLTTELTGYWAEGAHICQVSRHRLCNDFGTAVALATDSTVVTLVGEVI